MTLFQSHLKTLVTYLAMLTLFIAGTRLVTALQKYTRSMPRSVAPEKLPLQQYLQLASHTVQVKYHDFRPAFDASVADAVSDERIKLQVPLRSRKGIRR